jgi:hydrogenase maturation factor HypF (carbamoyltransferase family)
MTINSTKKHLDITVKGKVQGVFYRASTKAVADQLGVRGTARNRKHPRNVPGLVPRRPRTCRSNFCGIT